MEKDLQGLSGSQQQHLHRLDCQAGTGPGAGPPLFCHRQWLRGIRETHWNRLSTSYTVLTIGVSPIAIPLCSIASAQPKRYVTSRGTTILIVTLAVAAGYNGVNDTES